MTCHILFFDTVKNKLILRLIYFPTQIKTIFYEHEIIGQGLQSLKGLKSLIHLNSSLARVLGLNLLSVLFSIVLKLFWSAERGIYSAACFHYYYLLPLFFYKSRALSASKSLEQLVFCFFKCSIELTRYFFESLTKKCVYGILCFDCWHGLYLHFFDVLTLMWIWYDVDCMY